MPSPDELLTTTQAGTILRRSGRTVARLVEAGQLAAAHRMPGPSGAVLIRRGDVEALAGEWAIPIICPACGHHLAESVETEANGAVA